MPLSHGNDRDESLPPLVSHGEQVLSQIAFHGDCCQGHDDYVPTIHVTSQSELAPQPSKRPPRPLNPFMLFLADFRKRKADSREKPTTIEGGKQWKASSPEVKEYYKKLALEASRKHALLYPAYTLQPKKGLERRPYGSRKRPARQSRQSESGVSETPSPAIGVLETAELTPDSSSLQPNYPYHPSQERQTQSTNTFISSCHDSFGIAPSHIPEYYGSVLGLSHIPHPPSRPSFLTRDASFSSPSTSFNSPSLPVHVSGFDDSPSTLSNSSSLYYSTETPPTPQGLCLTPYAHSPSTNQLAFEPANPYPSPHLYFQQLTLNDDFSTYPATSTSTLPLAPIFRPVTLPQTQVIDQESSPFPEVSSLSQERSFTSSSNSMPVSHYNDLATPDYWLILDNQPNP